MSDDKKKYLDQLLALIELSNSEVITQQGLFTYQLNGQATEIFEPWVILKTEPGERIVSARFVPNAEIEIIVDFIDEKGGNTHGAITWRDKQHNSLAEFTLTAQKLSWQITRKTKQGQEIKESGEEIFGSSYRFFPLMRIFTGKLLLQMQQQQSSEANPLQVLVPDIRTPTEIETLLKPYASSRYATPLQDKEQSAPLGFLLISDLYQPEQAAECFINEQGILMQYSWQQTAEQFWLVKNHLID